MNGRSTSIPYVCILRPVHASIVRMRGSVTDIDYKELLEKYIVWVGSCEGVDFLSDDYLDRKDNGYFTPEEIVELLRLSGRQE